ncbi:MAG: hypothetical protein JSS43_13750 [Proteobacteria bacterium]|nr:hypothetical protein [Pseudomonadota bacterium]
MTVLISTSTLAYWNDRNAGSRQAVRLPAGPPACIVVTA